MRDTQLPLIVPRGAGEYPAHLYSGAPPSVEQDTSAIAAGSVRVPSAHWRQIILDWITERDEYGSTCDEAELCLRNLRHQTCGPRIRELVQLGVVKDSGQRRPTRSGRAAIVWVLTRAPDTR